MDLKILDYQKKDAEKIKIERTLSDSPNRKGFLRMFETAKNAQAKSAELEKSAGEIASEHENLKRTYDQTVKTIEAYEAKKVEEMTEEELSNLTSQITKISQNLNLLDKKISQNSERINVTLSEFEKTKKLYASAREKHAEFKKLYDAEFAKIEPQIEKIETELKALEKSVNADALNKYKAKRQDKIFPVFVPLADNACGGCRMEMPSAVVAKINNAGALECENCHRFIYVNK